MENAERNIRYELTFNELAPDQMVRWPDGKDSKFEERCDTISSRTGIREHNLTIEEATRKRLDIVGGGNLLDQLKGCYPNSWRRLFEVLTLFKSIAMKGGEIDATSAEALYLYCRDMASSISKDFNAMRSSIACLQFALDCQDDQVKSLRLQLKEGAGVV